jgi:hypothetical protein
MLEMKTKFTLLILSSILIFSCQEAFNPEDLDQSKKIPVIIGSLTEGKGPFIITMYWASGFESNNMNYINGAKVNVIDDLGNIYTYKQVSPGHYRSDTSKLKCKTGRAYTLRIITSDNITFESTPELLENKPVVDTMYAEIGLKAISSKDIYGDLNISYQKGLYIYTDYKIQSDTTQFLKFNTLTVTQTKAEMIGIQNPPTIYCRYIGLDNEVPDVKETYSVNPYQMLKKHNVTFLPYVYDINGGTDSTAPPMIAGWLVDLTVSRISAHAYRYYKLIADQLTANSSIFDPVPSKITGNISCINDSLSTVLGFFEVYSSSSICYGFSWYTGATKYVQIKVEGSGPIQDTCGINKIPVGWVWIQ